MTELSTLERKRLSDLHQIASQLGIKQYRKYRKPELAEMIYKVATEQAASQQTTSQQTTTNGAATAPPEAPAEAPATNGEAVAPTVTEPAVSDDATSDSASGNACARVAAYGAVLRHTSAFPSPSRSRTTIGENQIPS